MHPYIDPCPHCRSDELCVRHTTAALWGSLVEASQPAPVDRPAEIRTTRAGWGYLLAAFKIPPPEPRWEPVPGPPPDPTTPGHLLGIPVKIDDDTPPDTLEFRDRDGQIVKRVQLPYGRRIVD